jgi:hypothetical protein
MITVENNAGRLVEITQTGKITLNELKMAFQPFQRILDRHKGNQVVLCTDWRGMEALSPDVSELLLEIMKSDNERVERQAVIHDPSAILGMGLNRLFRESGGNSRQAFDNVEGASAWLNTVALTVAERVQLRNFLARRIDAPRTER